MRILTLFQPQRLVFGSGCADHFVDAFAKRPEKRLLMITAPPIRPLLEGLVDKLRRAGNDVEIVDRIAAEPSSQTFTEVLAEAEQFGPDSVLGIGGGSVLDVAKLVAALYGSEQRLEEVFGTDFLTERKLFLALMPTTAGTGSEVSKNAILLDLRDGQKKAVISPHLVPDWTYVDPLLTISAPPGVTAVSGLDALTHCIEVYTNQFAHPYTDLLALEGVRLIGRNLLRAYQNGRDKEAREKLALGSLYGGLGLGPVNTAAVHALAYPLGSRYKLAHGLSNAVLLPYVTEFNIPGNPDKYADIARALGVKAEGSAQEIAHSGVEKLKKLIRACGVPLKLSELGIKEQDLPKLAEEAMKVERLLRNNPRPVSYEDALVIYRSALN